MEIDKPIATAIILLVILVSVFYLIIPKYQTFRDLLVKTGTMEAELKGKSVYFIEITKNYRELMQYQDSLNKIESALPDKIFLGPLINFLYQKSFENGVIIQKINVFSKTSSDKNVNFNESKISLDLFGPYVAFKNFLASLEKSARLIEGEGFSFSVTAPSTANPAIQETYPIKLDIKIYSY